LLVCREKYRKIIQNIRKQLQRSSSSSKSGFNGTTPIKKHENLSDDDHIDIFLQDILQQYENEIHQLSSQLSSTSSRSSSTSTSTVMKTPVKSSISKPVNESSTVEDSLLSSKSNLDMVAKEVSEFDFFVFSFLILLFASLL
jgi:predicted component of viral defense system (DUF524 family)